MKYHFHFKASSFPFSLTELCWNDRGYGMFDYHVLQEKDLLIGYCSDIGVRQQYEYGRDNFFDDEKRGRIFREIDEYDDRLARLKIPEKENGMDAVKERAYWLRVYEQIRVCFKEFGKVYFNMEPMPLAALAEFVTNICERDGLEQDKVLGDISIAKNFSPEERGLVRALHDFGEKKLSIHNHIEAPLRKLHELIHFIAEQLSVPLAHTEVMRDSEILEFLRTGVPPAADLETRSKGIILTSGNGISVGDGEEYRKWKNILEPSFTGDIKGTVAFRGKVTGTVVIHLSWIDTTPIPEGSVLVTGMTNPQMIPFIRGAGAIVTDEGGLTCHAAIISREMKIPCIVGTKVATQVLKNGDLVEVDAEKGIVRIIERK